MKTSQACKICRQPTTVRHRIDQIDYHYCSSCNFLQNYHWESESETAQTRSTLNNKIRASHWPAGDPQEMYKKGWDMLELMAWPPAWFSRHLHTNLRYIPGYENLYKNQIRQKMRSIADFGCGHGIIVDELRKRDKFNIIGIDPFSPIENPHIIREFLPTPTLKENSLQGIFAIETMEHIPNVLETFKELNRLLVSRGVLLVQTRRLEDEDYAKQGANWFYLEMPRMHVAIYSEKALRRIAAKTGWSNVSFRGTRYARLIK